MLVHPPDPPLVVAEAWKAALSDARVETHDAALVWRPGRPRATGQEAASWRPSTDIVPEFDDDVEFAAMLHWANRPTICDLRRVLIWIGRTHEGIAGLLRHELEHTIQLAAAPELEELHHRAVEELDSRQAAGRSYNAIPMELDANRAAARFLRRLFSAERLRQLACAGGDDALCFRTASDPEPLDTLVARMEGFIGNVMSRDDFVPGLETGPPLL